ncbi:MAG: peptidase family protein [Ilumatobacteraceae bacterium]|nr:peptidase family protein [Ilumatobacteraceae bacterium]
MTSVHEESPADAAVRAVAAIADELFRPEAQHGASLALVVSHRGEVVLERYGTRPATAFGPGGPVGPETGLISWSMAKSITHAAVGILVGDGLLRLDAPAPVPAWAGSPKARITLQDLLDMRSGLAFVEDYVDDAISNCLEMLFGAGRDDVAGYAADLPLADEPGTAWSYSSGTTNIICRIIGDALGDRSGGPHEGMTSLLVDRLFAKVGMSAAEATFDAAGTFVGSSYVHATARDFARFGELYLRDGLAADGTRVLPVGWRDHARTFVAHDPDGEFDYGRHWWLWPGLPGALACHGYEGQYIVVVPDRELVVVHLGKSPVEQRPPLVRGLRSIIAAFPVSAS